MRHFLKIADAVDVMPILASLTANLDLWNANSLRTTYPDSPHAQADDIWIRFNFTDGDVANDIQCHAYPAWHLLPVKDVALNIMRRVGGTQLGRVIITRLAPGAVIAPHADWGAPADFYERYHLALQSLPGALVYSGGEVIQYAAGEVWWFDNRAEHSVVNNSADDRIVMIVDIRTC